MCVTGVIGDARSDAGGAGNVGVGEGGGDGVTDEEITTVSSTMVSSLLAATEPVERSASCILGTLVCEAC
jgi:hypothetical protein